MPAAGGGVAPAAPLEHSDPRTGESSYRLQNIIRAEPDRSLFMVPPDYEVKDTGIRRMLEASVKKH